jgi:hypothetical protein
MSYQYYGTRAGLKFDPSQVRIAPRIANDARPLFEDVKCFAGAGRVWVVQVHTDEGPLDERNLMLLAMDQIGSAAMSHLETGAGAWLYDCGAASQLKAQQFPNVQVPLQAHLHPRGDDRGQIRDVAE